MRREIIYFFVRFTGRTIKSIMSRIKGTAAAIGMMTLSISSFAQRIDSTLKTKPDSLNFQKKVVAVIADKFAIARPLNIEYIYTAPYNYKSQKGESILPNGRVTNFQQVKVSANINFIKRKTWMLGTTLGYRYSSTEADIARSGTTNINVNDDFHYLFSSLNLTYFSSLFKKRMIYSSSVLVDGSDQHFERIKGIFTGTMVLKATQNTKMTAGILINIDASAQSPFIPTFSYEHKFTNGLIADIVLPRSLYLRRFISQTGRLSLGTELDRTSFYLYNLDGTSQKYEYRQLDINSGLNYEQVIGKYFMLTAKSGIKLTPSGRIFKKEESYADPVYQTSPDPAFYFNMGISFNPFSVFGKKQRKD